MADLDLYKKKTPVPTPTSSPFKDRDKTSEDSFRGRAMDTSEFTNSRESAPRPMDEDVSAYKAYRSN